MPRKPNLLFIFTDEQRADTLGAYGNRSIRTPNLDRLANQSVLFENAYVTQSVCTPSRSTIMTGLWPHTNGCTANNIPLREETPTIAEMMDRDNCAFGYHGKWHLGDEVVAQHGFDEWVSIEDFYWMHSSRPEYEDLLSDYCRFLDAKGIEPDGRRGKDHELPQYSRDLSARLPEELGKPAFLAENTCRFIEQNRDRRFCLFVNFLEPHMPFFGPRDHEYPPAEVTLPDNFEHQLGADVPEKCRRLAEHYRRKGHSGLKLETEADWRRMIANYWGLVSLVDSSVGRILGKLNECGLDDETIVVFTSDHGDMMGSHRLLAKTVQFEEALRVPLTVRLPGVSPRRITERVSQIDLVPTLLELMGEVRPDSLQGASLASPISRGRPFEPRDVFVEWNSSDLDPKNDDTYDSDSDTAVRTVISPKGWKFNWGENGECELYNLASDPLETENLFGRPENAAVISDLEARIRTWQEQTADTVALPGVS